VRGAFFLRVLRAAAAIAVVGLVLGAGTSSAAGTPHLPAWLDNGRGPWIAHVCALPIPGIAGCQADVVTDSAGRPLASGSPPSGALGPSQFHSAYNLPTTAPGTQTIGIVDAYDDPNIASDLANFDSYYGLAAPPSFQKVNQSGGTSYPSANSGWDLEIALDVETAHAICQNCNILLVEASSNSLANLGAAENEAVKLGATVISNSWGANEYSSETSDESSYFKHPGVAITASAGDNGYGVEFPAASQYVTAVGGTTLNLSNGSYGSESVWNGTGSGCSQYEPKPSWQHDSGCSHRTLNDVSADADPNTGAAVYDSISYYGQTGWFQVGGTSLASPLIAAVYALAGTPTSVTYGSAPYAAAAGQLHDVTSGSNGSCGGSYLCTAGSGYDGPTGLGTPNGVGAFSAAPSTTPGAPTSLTAAAGNASVSLSWTAPTNTGGSNITGYKVYRGTSAGGESSTAVATVTSGTTFNDTGLTNGTTYYYVVTAVNQTSNESGKSNEASATPATVPGAPTLQASAGNQSVSLSWTAPNNGGAPITKYNIYRGTSSNGETLLTSVSGTSYTDTGLINGTTYYYEVSAVNSVNEGARSNEQSATPTATAPGAPTSLSATAGNGSVSLAWTAPSNNGGASVTYKVYRGTSAGGESSTPVATGVASTSYNDTAVTNGITYYYYVTASNSSGDSTPSNEVSATPTAPPAGDFSISISPTSRWIGSSGSTTYTVTITPSNGFSGQVSLSVSGLPAHVAGSFSPNPATTSSTLTITSSGASYSNVTITVTGSSGSLTHSATTRLVVF
jgi:fibronectin type 3 domain-containing protein